MAIHSPVQEGGILHSPDYWLKPFTHLLIRFRGDGRTYNLNLHCPDIMDITQFDMFSYPLFTRGGPYWQVAKVPFTQLIFNAKGRLQDKQWHVPLHRVQRWSVSLTDRVDGPFALEIDYMAACVDAFHDKSTLWWEKYPYKYM